MDRHGDHRLHLSTQGTLYAGRENHRENVGVEKSVSERSGLRNAHADLLHQSSWTRAERFSTSRARESKAAPRRKGSSWSRSQDKKAPAQCERASMNGFICTSCATPKMLQSPLPWPRDEGL